MPSAPDPGRRTYVPLAPGGIGAGLGVVVGGLAGGLLGLAFLPLVGAGVGGALGVIAGTRLATSRRSSRD